MSHHVNNQNIIMNSMLALNVHSQEKPLFQYVLPYKVPSQYAGYSLSCTYAMHVCVRPILCRSVSDFDKDLP
jgi:hypothetical protein